MSDNALLALGLICGSVVVFSLGIFTGSELQKSYWRDGAIERGYAKYDELTCKLQWIETAEAQGVDDER